MKPCIAIVRRNASAGNTANAQPVEGKRNFASTAPVIESISERICHRFAEGALERYLSIEFETRREMIEAVVRRGYQQLREENRGLRQQLREERTRRLVA